MRYHFMYSSPSDAGTPCGTGAYGVVSRTEGAVCMSSQWVVGIGGDKTVYWLRSSDDCERLEYLQD